MKTEEAMEILSSVTLDERHPEDPKVCQALDLAERNPELKDWIARQKRLDPRIRTALQSAPVPEGLEEKLLGQVRSNRSKPCSSIFRNRWLYGVAAVLAIGFVSVFLYRDETILQNIQRQVAGKDHESFSNLRDGMAYYISSIYFQLDHISPDLNSIENWLQEKQVPSYDDLPEELIALDPIGCKELLWRGRKVALVCFHNDTGGIVHLFIMDQSEADPSIYEGISEVAISQGLETGGWTSNGKVYLLVGSEKDVDIEFALG